MSSKTKTVIQSVDLFLDSNQMSTIPSETTYGSYNWATQGVTLSRDKFLVTQASAYSPDNPKFILDTPIDNVVGYSIQYVNVPFSFFVIDDTCNEFGIKFFWSVPHFGVDSDSQAKIRIPPGTYNPQQLEWTLRQAIAEQIKRTNSVGLGETTDAQIDAQVAAFRAWVGPDNRLNMIDAQYQLDNFGNANGLADPTMKAGFLSTGGNLDANSMATYGWPIYGGGGVYITNKRLAFILGFEPSPTETTTPFASFKQNGWTAHFDVNANNVSGLNPSSGMYEGGGPYNGIATKNYGDNQIANAHHTHADRHPGYNVFKDGVLLNSGNPVYWLRGHKPVQLLGEPYMKLECPELKGISALAPVLDSNRPNDQTVMIMPITGQFGSFMYYTPNQDMIRTSRSTITQLSLSWKHGTRGTYYDTLHDRYTSFLPFNGPGFQVCVRLFIDTGIVDDF